MTETAVTSSRHPFAELMEALAGQTEWTLIIDHFKAGS